MIEHPLFLSDTLVQALGWTLLHSLWQGAALAAVLWLALPRISGSSRRYWAAYAALMGLVFLAGCTFAWVYTTYQPAVAAGAPLLSGAEPYGAAIFVMTETVNAGGSFGSAISAFLEPYQPLIVSIWLLGFVFFLAQVLFGLHFVYRLRRQQNRALGEGGWQEKIRHLTQQLGYSKPVGLLESALVKVPMALGFLKPVILLPLGMVNQLSPEQVEAILAHELAHIARRDGLFNLVQTIVEAVFYYHPAVWWMASVVRAERENCCDDTAVALTGNRLVYAKTLVQLQELAYKPQTPALALGLQGASGFLRRRPMLLHRIQRILHQPQPSASPMEKTIALAILIALATLFTLSAHTPPALVENLRAIAEKPISWIRQTPPAAWAFQAVSDSVPAPKQRQRIIRDDDNQRVEIELENGAISLLKIDGKTIEPAQYGQYKTLTDEVLSELPPAPPAPAAPPAPFEKSWTPAPPPPPGAPFPPRAPSRISTDTDGAGNTVIRVERNGAPLEIRVKNGEVWVGDKKMEAGESMELPGEAPAGAFWWNDGERNLQMEGQRFLFRDENGNVLEVPGAPAAPHIFQFDQNGEHFIFRGMEGQTFEMPQIEINKEELIQMQEGALLEQRKALREVEEEMRQLEKEGKKNRREWSAEQRAQYQALEEARRALQEAQRDQREAQRAQRQELEIERRALEDHQRANREYRIARIERPGAETLSASIQRALVQDGLIADPNNYSVDLSSKGLKVNGKKQPDLLHQKYLDLYYRKTGRHIGNNKIRIEVKD